MKQRSLWVVGRVAIVALLLSALIVSPALAASIEDEEAEEVEFTGTVVSVTAGETGCTLVVSVEADGVTSEYTVQAPAGFECDSVVAGDTVEVEGTLGEGGVIVATKVAVEGEEGDEGEKENCFCLDPELVHPAAMRLATMYGVTYEQVMSWFCGGAGFGQIMLALQTAKIFGTAPEDGITDGALEFSELAGSYLSQRDAGQGWGPIWQGLGLIGKGKKAGDTSLTAQTEGDDAGKPKGHGKPAWAGQGRGKKK